MDEGGIVGNRVSERLKWQHLDMIRHRLEVAPVHAVADVGSTAGKEALGAFNPHGRGQDHN